MLRIPGIAVNDFSGSSSDSVLKYKDRLLADNLADNNISREVDSDIIEEKQKEVISLPVLMKELGSRKIDGILLEGMDSLTRVHCRQESYREYIATLLLRFLEVHRQRLR